MRNTTLNSRQDLPGDAADLLVFPGALGNLTDSVTSGVARLVVLMSGEESIVKRVEAEFAGLLTSRDFPVCCSTSETKAV